MQEVLTTNGSKKQSRLDELYLHRKIYYYEMVQNMNLLRKRKNELINIYNLKVKELDKEIAYEFKRNKNKK